MMFRRWITLLFAADFLGCHIPVPVHSYYQKEYSSYLFTLPGSYDAEYRSQIDASQWCNRNGSKLLAIQSVDIQNAAVAFINHAIQQHQLTANNIITDGRRNTSEWTWINETNKTPLNIDDQDSPGTRTQAYLNKLNVFNYKLVADQPTSKKYYICEGQMFCANGYQINEQCFLGFSNERLTWYDARNRCLEKGGDLATFEFITINSGFNTLEMNGSWIRQSTDYWIGLRKQWWTWQSTQSQVTYSQWSNGEPGASSEYSNSYGACLCLLPYDWKWGKCGCDKQDPAGLNWIYFVCMSDLRTLSSTSTSLSSRESYASTVNTPTSTVSPTLQSTSSSNHSIATTFVSETSRFDNEKLTVGLAVGLTIGIPAVIIITIVAVMIAQLKRKLSSQKQSNHSPNNSVVDNVGSRHYEDLKREDNVSNPYSTLHQELQTQ